MHKITESSSPNLEFPLLNLSCVRYSNDLYVFPLLMWSLKPHQNLTQTSPNYWPL